MPALISNFLFAERVLSEYRRDGTEKVVEDAFLWGAQGYEFLFCKPNKQCLTEGFQAFQKNQDYKGQPQKVLNCVREEILPNHGGILFRSYYRGLACNCIFLQAVSPFCHARLQALQATKPNVPENSLRNELTASLDTILLRYERGELPTEFDLMKVFPASREVLECIAEIYCGVLKKLCGITAAKDDILQAEKACRSETGRLNDRTGLKRLFYQRYEKHHPNSYRSCSFRGIMEDSGFDYANILSSPWSWPLSQKEKSTAGFLDLFEDAAGKALHVQRKIGSLESPIKQSD